MERDWKCTTKPGRHIEFRLTSVKWLNEVSCSITSTLLLFPFKPALAKKAHTNNNKSDKTNKSYSGLFPLKMKSQEEVSFPTATFQNECWLREPLGTWLDPSYFSYGEQWITTLEVCVVSVSAGTHRVSVIWAGPAFSLHVERRICHSLFPPSLLPPSKLKFSLVVNSTSPKRLWKNSWDQPSVCCELHAICAS